MRKKLYVNLIILLFLVSSSCQSSSTQPDCIVQICPLTRYNIETAGELLEDVQELLEDIQNQGISVPEVELVLTEAREFLQKAEMLYRNGHNCIAANFFALKAIDNLKKAQEVLESTLRMIREEEYAVYAALIDTGFDLIRFIYSRDEVHLIVIIDHTSGGKAGSDLEETLEWVTEEMPEVEQETCDNFLIKNEQSYPLGDFFNLTTTVILLSNEEARKIFQEGGGWKEFYMRYPISQGIMDLSRVGFNSEMNQALVYLANVAEDSIGSGYYVLLRKENNVWIIQCWISQWIY